MMRRFLTIIVLCVGCHLAADAQTTFTQRLQQQRQGEGRVTITQSKEITDLVNGPQVVETEKKKATTPAKQSDTTKAQQQQQQKPDSSNTEQKPDSSKTTTPQSLPTDTTQTLVPDDHKKLIKGGHKIPGYRVQVFAGANSRDSRVKAERIGKEINALFPGEPVYVHFYSPRWICRMGNYRTYEEAHDILQQVKKLGYQSAIIVKGKITVQY